MPKSKTSQNHLKESLSPYLLQHANNPVHWWPWCPEALALAREQDKPILLSVGYAACHWCHVMAHESFEDPETAAFMNDHFINIKVDREERPDLDAIYQRTLQHAGGHGGWPLTMFLGADARPFFGGTYFPDKSRYGMPSFLSVLVRIRDIYAEDQSLVKTNSAALWQALTKSDQPLKTEPSVFDEIYQIEDRLLALFDTQQGGIRGAPKFPQIPMLKALWGRHWASGEGEFKAAVILSLEKICRGGIYDHLGGGFHRYSTDEKWLAPHFEKMLYDNAQIIEMLAFAWAREPNPLFRDTCKETVTWLLREMTTVAGAFSSSLDADSEGREGEFYLWDSAEIKKHLGTDYALFASHYNVNEGGNWEQRTILNRLQEVAEASPKDKSRLEKAKTILLKVRSARPRPSLDDKTLTDWNGMMISALLITGRIFGQKTWLTAAARAFDAILQTEQNNQNRLCHAARDKVSGQESFIDDYAHMIRAALLLYETTTRSDYLAHAKRWLERAYDQFGGPGGGFYFTSANAGDSPIRLPSTSDDATPAAGPIMLSNLAHLSVFDDSQELVARGDALSQYLSAQFLSNPYGWASFAPAARAWLHRRSVHIEPAPSKSREDDLMTTAIACGCPDLPIMPGDAPEGAPLAGPPETGPQEPGKGAAYLCTSGRCLPPICDPQELQDVLSPGKKW